MSKAIYPVSVYTVRRKKDLDQWASAGVAFTFRENKRWVSMAAHLERATNADAALPILFAAGESIDGVIYEGRLTRLVLSEARSDDAEFSEITVTSLRRIRPKRPLSDLRLISTGRPLSDSFIRPYAICHTPSFVLER